MRLLGGLVAALVAMLCWMEVVAAVRDYYVVLGIARTASDREIKSAYRKIARTIHPDKHPDKAEAFMELSEAYQMLSDADLRAVYDRHGAEAAQQHQTQKSNGQRSGDAFDLFRQFFGGGGGDEARKGPRQTYQAELELHELYTGRAFSLAHTRSIVCPRCYGSGAKSSSDVHTCTQCNGAGAQIVRQQIMPGFSTNVQVACTACGGKGKTITKVCPRCHGAKTTVEQTELDVEVEPGAREGAEYVFEGMGEQSPDHEPGDVLVTVRSRTAPGDFRRVQHDLYFTQVLTLEEALLGFTKKKTHYDGHVITMRRTTVTQPGYTERIEDEGFPIPPDEREQAQGRMAGDLFVTYTVVLPETSSARRKTLAEAFRAPAHTDL